MIEEEEEDKEITDMVPEGAEVVGEDMVDLGVGVQGEEEDINGDHHHLEEEILHLTAGDPHHHFPEEDDPRHHGEDLLHLSVVEIGRSHPLYAPDLIKVDKDQIHHLLNVLHPLHPHLDVALILPEVDLDLVLQLDPSLDRGVDHQP